MRGEVLPIIDTYTSKSEKIFLRILQREFTYAIMPVGRKEIRRSFIVTNPRKSRTLSGVFNSIPAWENQDHRLVTNYLLPSNHLMM